MLAHQKTAKQAIQSARTRDCGAKEVGPHVEHGADEHAAGRAALNG
jgi:hypothetical protein